MPALRARADLQGLRAVAVLLVVLAHAGVPGIPGGYVGVDVFFVLSGFLITSILLHEATADGAVSLIGFYAKRARRILPAATVTLVVTAAAATVLLSYVRADQLLTDVLWAAFFGANIHFARQSTDYFAADTPVSAVQHFWSLAVEEQFYVVWPALLAVVLVTGARHNLRAVRRRLPLLRRVLLVLSSPPLPGRWSRPPPRPTPRTSPRWPAGGSSASERSGSRRARVAAAHLARPAAAEHRRPRDGAGVRPSPSRADADPRLPHRPARAGDRGPACRRAGVTDERLPWVSRMLGRQPLRWIETSRTGSTCGTGRS
jgi:peptidoglycan/LPS O-acetylase OafA/YrhL